MLESLKRFFRVYPLPIFVLLLTFVIYYFAFELFKKQNSAQTPISQEESMQITQDSNQDVQSPQDSMQVTQTELENTQTTQEVAPPLESQPANLESPESKTIYLTTNVRSLNIRKTPNANAAVVGKFTAHARFIKLDEQDGWALIGDSTSANPVGWVLQSFTKEVKEEMQQEVAQIESTMESKTESKDTNNVESQNLNLYTSKVPSLNIRENPNTEARILGKLTPNDSVIILAENGIWVKIQDSSATCKNGWVVRRSLIPRN